MKVPVTVLMPAYNVEKYIREAIDSVLCQSFSQFELLIVDDGSTDGTASIIKSYTDKRIKLIQQPNGGVSAALNRGLKEAQGDYIARFDADDVCYPNRLEEQFRFMEANPDYVLIGSDADYMCEEGEFLFTNHNIGYSNEEIQERVDVYCPFIHSTVMYRNAIVQKLGGYEVLAYTFEDYFLWKKFIKEGKVCNFKTPLIKVRFNASSVTIDEKDRGKEFTQLKKKALMTGKITEEEGARMKATLLGLSREKKESSYHRMLGKKYLWNNYQPKKARFNLKLSIKIEPLKIQSYLLYLMSFLPGGLIQRIYRMK